MEEYVSKNFEYRTLKTEELTQWFRFIEGVFEVTSDYFVRHWEQDPERALSGIFVCIVDNKIVSTVRVFHRTIYMKGRMLSMGGIGEVSTLPEYRRKGIASKLLHMAIEYMEKNNMVVSVLTGSQNIYSIMGWQSVPIAVNYTKIPVAQVEEKPSWSIRKVSYKYLTETEKSKIRDIYTQTSLRFSGPLVRSQEYWETWVTTESPSTWIITENNDLKGYFSLKLDGPPNVVIVKEFLISEEIFTNIKNIFEWAIAVVLKELNKVEAVVWYAAILGSFGEISEVVNKTNQMYKLLSGCSESDTVVFNLFKEDGIKSHLWWTTDSF